MKDLTEQLQLLLEKAKGDKKCLIALKNASVAGMQFELAAELRDIENKIFPESEEYKKAKKTAEEISLLFRMLEVNSDNGTAWLIYEAITAFNKRKSKFDMKDCATLLAKRHEYFSK